LVTQWKFHVNLEKIVWYPSAIIFILIIS
jgi:hypothetical protein